MTVLGHICDGNIILDEPIALPEGAPVRIELLQTEQDDSQLADARRRIQELFRTVKGFRMTSKIPREELYERGSLH